MNFIRKNWLEISAVLFIVIIGFSFGLKNINNKNAVILSNTKTFSFQEIGRMRDGDGIQTTVVKKEMTGPATLYLFLASDGSIIDAFPAHNYIINSPEVRIEKGQKQDYFVVTNIGEEGTGLITHYDYWYDLSNGIEKPIWSYPANGRNNTCANKKGEGYISFCFEFKSRPVIVEGLNRMIIGGRIDYEINFLSEKIKKTAWYKWNEKGSQLIVDGTKSDLTFEQIDNFTNWILNTYFN